MFNFKEMQRQIFRPTTSFVRGFAAAAAKKKGPLKIYSPAGTYAHTLLNTCLEEKVDLRTVSDGMSAWQHAYESTPKLRRFLADSEFDYKHKDGKLEETVYKDLGLTGEDHMITREMISVCIEAGHYEMLPEIAVDFENLVLDHTKQVKCVVTSAEKLSPANEEKISKKIKSLIEKDENFTVEYQIDESIIGGLTLKLGQKFQDLSVRSALMRGESALRAM